jgi:hypothetical protein
MICVESITGSGIGLPFLGIFKVQDILAMVAIKHFQSNGIGG